METLLHIGLSNALLATVLAALAAVVGAVTRRPALAHGLWLLVLLKLVTPPFVHIPILPSAPAPLAEESAVAEDAVPITPEELQQILSESETGDANAVEPASTEEGIDGTKEPRPSGSDGCAPSRSRLLTALGGLWLAGSAGWFLLAAYRVWRFRGLLCHAKPVPSELHAEIGRLGERLGLRRCPEVRFVPGPLSPMLWSLGGPPLLLLPMELWERLTGEQRQTLAAHELAHLARRDHWVRALELLATGLYWWNPVTWWARLGLREAEERCCDAWVVWALPEAARAYATALVETVGFLSEARPALPAAASGIGHVRILKRRLTMILQGKTPRALSATGFLALAAVAALTLPLLPTWAQEPPAPKKPAQAFDEIRVEFQQRALAAPEERLRQLLIQLEAARAAAGGAEELDRVIADLKKKLAELEAKRAREKAKPTEPDKKKAAEIAKARAEVKAAQERLHAAVKRLAELEGKNFLFRFHIDGNGMEPIILQQKWGEGKPPMILYRRAVENLTKIQGKPASNEERLERLEKQLGELLREVQELRKERKKPGQPRGAADQP